MESNMEKNMIDIIARVLHSFPGTSKSMPYNDLKAYVNTMKPKQKKYMKVRLDVVSPWPLPFKQICV